MKVSRLPLACLVALALAACSASDEQEQPVADGRQATEEITVTEAELAGNPFMEDWDTPYGVPPFASIADEHYMPALKKGLLDLREEIAAIVANPEQPDFGNTILALEMTGTTLNKSLYTFSNITSTELNDTLRDLQTRVWPMVSREQDAITLNDALFQKVRHVYERRDTLGLDEQAARLLELTHRRFVRAGAALEPAVKEQVASINAELAGLTTRFAQNLLTSTKAFKLNLTEDAEVAGLSDDFKANLWNEDAGAWVVGLNRSVYETFMSQASNRDLRKQLFDAYRLRASGGEYDNGPLAIQIAQLRARRAELMGYRSHAHYQLEPRMAKTPEEAEQFLLKVWKPGLERAREERADLQALIGDAFTLGGHDWWHYSEKLRLARFDLDANALKPYFRLDEVRAGAFEMARRLFGLRFEPVDVPSWNPVVSSYDVRNADGSHLGLFMMDMYARDSKRGGAWMSGYRAASNMMGETIRPIITNNLNLASPPAGQPALMRFSEVETLFHEFGHGLHGLMTQIDYPSFSGVDGPRDYTEFPAQILEHWAAEPEMLALFAKHFESGEVIPKELIERMRTAANFNQGFATTEYIAASLLDLRWHMLTSEQAAQITDARAFEKKVLDEYGLIDEIEPRYRTQYFSHIFAGGYSAGYYAYLWSEILDADGFNAFREAEDIFSRETAARLRKWVYEAGGLREADELYRNFRGADPSIEPLLIGRGFIVDDETTGGE